MLQHHLWKHSVCANCGEIRSSPVPKSQKRGLTTLSNHVCKKARWDQLDKGITKEDWQQGQSIVQATMVSSTKCTCELCATSTPTPLSLWEHKVAKHWCCASCNQWLLKWDAAHARDCGLPVFCCTQCEFYTPTKQLLEAHQAKSHGHRCECCYKEFTTRASVCCVFCILVFSRCFPPNLGEQYL